MDFSRLKLEIYDLVAIILPGLLLFCEGWILLRGWQGFILAINQASGNRMFLLIVLAFALGHLTQELSVIAVKAMKGERYVRNARDRFWGAAKAQLVRDAIRKDFGQDIPNVDTAFDYCLTRLQDRFDKRGIFVATSDLCRSLVVLSALGLAPAARIAFQGPHLRESLEVFAGLCTLLAATAALAWHRMTRFRELSETTVFHSYLAMLSESASRP